MLKTAIIAVIVTTVFGQARSKSIEELPAQDNVIQGHVSLLLKEGETETPIEEDGVTYYRNEQLIIVARDDGQFAVIDNKMGLEVVNYVESGRCFVKFTRENPGIIEDLLDHLGGTMTITGIIEEVVVAEQMQDLSQLHKEIRDRCNNGIYQITPSAAKTQVARAKREVCITICFFWFCWTIVCF